VNFFVEYPVVVKTPLIIFDRLKQLTSNLVHMLFDGLAPHPWRFFEKQKRSISDVK